MGLTKSAAGDETLPLTGNPYFSVVIRKSHTGPAFALQLPVKIQRLLPKAVIPVILWRGDKSWKGFFYGNYTFKKFDPNWKRFVLDNRVKVGDVCCFEIMNQEKGEFKVQILGGELPPGFVEAVRQRGKTASTPIMID